VLIETTEFLKPDSGVDFVNERKHGLPAVSSG